MLAQISGVLPWSLAEWIEALLIVCSVVFVGRGLRKAYTGQVSLKTVGLNATRQIVTFVLWALVFFYSVWGLNYARSPASDRLGWESLEIQDLADPTELPQLVRLLRDLSNQTYREIHGTDDAGTPTESPPYDVLHRHIEEGYSQATRHMGLHPDYAKTYPPPKPLISSWIFTRLGITGFYFPFTGEANFNQLPPSWSLPMTLAHEKAHQRGVASEDEANFFGFLACVYSADPHVRYSAFMFAYRQLLYPLFMEDPEAALQIYEGQIPGIQRDLWATHSFWTGHESGWTEVGGALNDAYLRANRVEGGTRSYAMSGRLIVSLHRRFPLGLSVSPASTEQDIPPNHP